MPTLLDKIWKEHVVREEPGRPDLLYADRHLVHEVTSPQAFEGLRLSDRKVRRPDLTFAVADHVIPTTDRLRPLADDIAEAQLSALEKNCADFDLPLFGPVDPANGVIHVTMPEQGIILPGQTVFCGDSHTATHGAFGALAFGVGTSEVEHLLATQCLPQKKPKSMAVVFEGMPGAGVYAKDMILAVIGRIGHGGGNGFIAEYMGQAISGLSMEGRMTVCNMSVECGAKAGLIAPDQTTFDYLEGLTYAPRGEGWEHALSYWKTLASDPEATYDRTVSMDVSTLAPQVSWGTNPGQVAALDSLVPDPASLENPDERKAAQEALAYNGLVPGTPFKNVAIDAVFIGSCTNGRIEDFREAGRILKGRKAAPGLMALAVPGSYAVKKQAEDEGLDRIFIEAGFEWRHPGCSMCLGMNPDLLDPGMRSASTSNRNFQGRQGRGSFTHLLSPASAAASAIYGRLSDPRPFLEN